MIDYDPSAYGDRLGADYDELYPAEQLETDDTVALLSELADTAPSRSLLELGIGTGRLAIELARRGVRVAGVDASERMLEALREKAPDIDIEVALGDYITTRLNRRFGVVAIVFNNILDPRGLSAQLALFESAAQHLDPGGFFVVEAFVLPESLRDGSWSVAPRYVHGDHVELQLQRFDLDTNELERTFVHLRADGTELMSVRDVYSSPGELDVMGFVNGLHRVARYSAWDRSPFTATSRRHITIYEAATRRLP